MGWGPKLIDKVRPPLPSPILLYHILHFTIYKYFISLKMQRICLMTQFSLITGKLKPKARGILLVTTDPPVKFMRCVKMRIL